MYQPWLADLFRLFTVTYNAAWTDRMVTEELSNAALALWNHHLHKYNPEVIREAALKCVKQFDFPPTPKQFIEIAEAMMRNQRMDDGMAIRDRERLLESPRQTGGSSRTVLEAKRVMWLKLGMHAKVKGIDDEIAALDLQEERDPVPCQENV